MAINPLSHPALRLEPGEDNSSLAYGARKIPRPAIRRDEAPRSSGDALVSFCLEAAVTPRPCAGGAGLPAGGGLCQLSLGRSPSMAWGAAAPAWDRDSPACPAQPPALPKSLGGGKTWDTGNQKGSRGWRGLSSLVTSLGDISPEPSWVLGAAGNCSSPSNKEAPCWLVSLG